MSDMSMVKSATNPGRSYKYYSGKPTVPFGHGISLTTFALQNVTGARNTNVDAASAAAADFSVKVTNTGDKTGDEVVLAFYHPPAGSKVLRAIFGFQRVHLSPGESKTVTFPVTPDALKTVTEDGDTVVATGDYVIELTNGVEETVSYGMTITGTQRLLASFPRL